ncbi:LexA family transcriptional regulator [Candidatus Parcubacteria bacterium]|nr:MAG: LexA family transcriptional regulator [Candidatus Parcubacteria bacterium]
MQQENEGMLSMAKHKLTCMKLNAKVSDIGARIKQRRKELGMTLKEAAKAAGVTHPTIMNWEKGNTKSFKEPYFSALIKALKTTPDWILYGKGPKEAISAPPGHNVMGYDADDSDKAVKLQFLPAVEWQNEEDLQEHGEYVFVPRIDIKADCGDGTCVLHEEPLDQRQAFRAEWFAQKGIKPQHAACIYATGDSMEPRIYEGDTLLIDRSPAARERIIDNKIYLIRYGDEIRVKQLQKRFDGGMIIRSFNKEKYPDEQITREELEKGGIEVLGRVVWIGSEM